METIFERQRMIKAYKTVDGEIKHTEDTKLSEDASRKAFNDVLQMLKDVAVKIGENPDDVYDDGESILVPEKMGRKMREVFADIFKLEGEERENYIENGCGEVTLGENIKSILAVRGMSQVELAKKSGITEVSISRYVNGLRVPKADHLKAIADALKVPMNVLFGETCMTCKHNKDCLGTSIIKDEAIDRYKDDIGYCYLWESDNQ